MRASLSKMVDGTARMRHDRVAVTDAAMGVHAARKTGAAMTIPTLTIVSSTSSHTVARRAAAVRRPYSGPTGPLIVELARCFISTHIARHIDAETLVGATLVSESTLRRAIQAETGMKVSSFVLTIKLDQAHAWLSTNRESRTQAQIAAALGWRSAAAFGRAYIRRFGEAMSMTRQRAVQLGEVTGRAANNIRDIGESNPSKSRRLERL